MSIQIQTILQYTKPLKLLYVEDNEEARRFTLELLSRFFDDITIAIDGQSGLGKFQTDSFDLIITDINMPKMGGIEMSAKIRESNNEIPIIVLSAHNEKSFLESAKSININEYLPKPLELKDFISVLGQMVQANQEGRYNA